MHTGFYDGLVMYRSTGLAQEKWSRVNNMNIYQNSQCLLVLERDVMELTMSCSAGGRRSQHNFVSISKDHLPCSVLRDFGVVRAGTAVPDVSCGLGDFPHCRNSR